MSRLFIFCVGVIGLSGLAAQVLLLRELLVSFYGNELTVGIVLANWLITESAGVYCAGRLIDRHKHKMAVFLSLELLFSAAFAFCIYFARVYKDMLGIPTGEGIGLTVIFWASLAAILPVSFIHGALFTTACRLYPDIASQRGEEGIGKVYAWETVGMIAGGVILTYLFLPFLTTFHSVFIVIVLNLLVCVLLLRTYRGRVMRLMVAACIACAGIGAAAGSIDRLHQESVRRQFKQGEVLDYRNSVYGNVAVTRSAGQYTFFSNGLPVITTPVPDITFAEDFANLGLAFHHRPRRVLIAGAGAGGLLHEVLKHPVERVDYLELDPLIITMVAAYATPLTQSELNDPRTRVHNLDARFFLSAAGREYDMILIGLSDPADLATNRLFTREFFSLARERLLPRGIITFWLPGSLSYLSEEMTALHAGILTALEDVFPAVRVIPGDYTIFLASGDIGLESVTPGVLSSRLAERNVPTSLLSEPYIAYRLHERYRSWFDSRMPRESRRMNRDLQPSAVFQTLLLWNKLFSPRVHAFLSRLESIDLRLILTAVALWSLVLGLFIRVRRARLASVTYSIATTGFFGMLANLVLVFGFQVYYGDLYHRIGLLISIFMAGSAAGSMGMTRILRNEKADLRLLSLIDAGIAAYCLTLAFVLGRLSFSPQAVAVIFGVLFFLCGFLVGCEFPLAGKLYLAGRGQVGETAGALSFADLTGGWVAGVLGGIACFAVFGVMGTCLLMAVLKLGSLFVLTQARA